MSRFASVGVAEFEKNMHEKNMEMIIRELMPSVKVNCVSYYMQKSDYIECVYMKSRDMMKVYVEDEHCTFGAEVESNNNVLRWRQYCSELYMNKVRAESGVEVSGACLVRNHQDCNEYISIGFVGKNCDKVARLLEDETSLRQQLIYYIRGYYSNNQSERVIVSLPEMKCRNISSLSKGCVMEEGECLEDRLYVYGNGGLCKLSFTEMQCWMCSMRLMSYKEISEKVGISTKKIESHMFNLRRKLHVRTKNELYQIAVNNEFM